MCSPWVSICSALREPPIPDRLDIVVEAQLVVGLISLDIDPALPVTRKQAEAANLPAHLLAKGEAFASVGDEEPKYDVLLAAWEEHRRLVDAQGDELLDRLREASARTPLDRLAGVVLALGPEGSAVSAVTREQTMKLVAEKPFLERKLARPAGREKLTDGREVLGVPIVTWAKGHVSVQTREVVEAK